VRRSLPILLSVLCWFWASRAVAEGKSVNDATAAEKNAAAATYKSAMADFDKNEFEAALKGFRESYDKVKSPNSRFMIARTLARLGRNAEAYEELNGVIADAGELGPKYEDTVHAAYAKLDEIKPRIGFVVVTVEHGPKDATVMVGEDKLAAGRLGKPVAVLPGETEVTVSLPGKDKRTQKVQVEAGATAEVKFDLATRDPAKPPPEPVYHAPYRLELEASVIGETLGPPYPVTRGAGAGIRAAFPVVDRGVLGSMDNFALSTGLDWIGTSTDPHFYIPAQFQWNLWLTKEFSLRFEPGAAVMFGAGSTRVVPSLLAGVRYKIWKSLHIHGRIGIPIAGIGVSLFL
jgi:hypothetical protein